MTEFKVGDKVRLKDDCRAFAEQFGLTGTLIFAGFNGNGHATFGGTPMIAPSNSIEHVPPAVTIDPARTYRTRDGREVRIYATDGGGDFPVHGAFRSDGVWFPDRWTESGAAYTGDGQFDLDLIEVKPERDGFVNVYHVPGEQGHGPVYANKAEADHFAMPGRIACLHVKFREGDGLEGGK